MYSEIGANEDGAESASNDWLLNSIEEPMVEDGTFVGVVQIVDGVVHLVVGEGVVGLVATMLPLSTRSMTERRSTALCGAFIPWILATWRLAKSSVSPMIVGMVLGF